MNQTLQRESLEQVMRESLPEMLHCLNLSENLAGNMDITVLEGQRARLRWQEQQSQQCCFENSQLNQTNLPVFCQDGFPACGLPEKSDFDEIVNRVKNDPGLENGWSEFGAACFVSAGNVVRVPDSGDLGFDFPRSSSWGRDFPAENPAKVRDSGFPEKITVMKCSPVFPKESPKKRKADKAQQRSDVSASVSKIVGSEEMKEKRIKADTEAARDEGDSEGIEQNNNNNNQRESSGDTAKDNSKASEVQKPDYIHVRARRGQATDSHSLAERVRREKISERMKYLQDLVPGCNKITGKAGMLDEIINYVQSLQRQVEFLSMKLAAVNPRLDFNIDNFFAKQLFQTCNSSFPGIGLSPEFTNASYLQFNPVHPAGSLVCGIDMSVNSPEITALRRTASAPVSVPDQFIDSSCFHTHGSSSTWDHELQNLYNMEFNQGRPSSFPNPTFQGGNLEINNLKMEM